MNNEFNLRLFAATKLKKLREQNNMTQDELADKISLYLKKEVKRQTISLYENGERGMNQDILFAIADIFNVSINDFFPPTTDETYKNYMNNNIFNKTQVLFDKTKDILSDSDRDIIEHIMQRTIEEYEQSKKNN